MHISSSISNLQETGSGVVLFWSVGETASKGYSLKKLSFVRLLRRCFEIVFEEYSRNFMCLWLRAFKSKMQPLLPQLLPKICLFVIISMSASVFGRSSENRTRRSSGSCGVAIRPSGFIVHGQDFPRGDFPWIVALMHKSRPPSFFCSGTLISSSFVISDECELEEPVIQLRSLTF